MCVCSEANVMFAMASDHQTLQMRYQFAVFGLPWARMLLICSKACATEDNRAMALDLGNWLGRVAFRLLPFTVTDNEIRDVVIESLTWYADLLDSDDDHDTAEEVRAVLRRLAD